MNNQDIIDHRIKIQTMMFDLHQEYNDKYKSLNNELKELMDKCKHTQTTFHSDPSGNSDSFYRCDICGKEL